jgi:hypothetical protein
MNTVIPSESLALSEVEWVEESRCVTLKITPRGPSTALRFARDDN